MQKIQSESDIDELIEMHYEGWNKTEQQSLLNVLIIVLIFNNFLVLIIIVH